MAMARRDTKEDDLQEALLPMPTAPSHAVVLSSEEKDGGRAFPVATYSMEAPPSYDFSILSGEFDDTDRSGAGGAGSAGGSSYYPMLPMTVAIPVSQAAPMSHGVRAEGFGLTEREISKRLEDAHLSASKESKASAQAPAADSRYSVTTTTTATALVADAKGEVGTVSPMMRVVSSRLQPDFSHGGRYFVDESTFAEASRIARERVREEHTSTAVGWDPLAGLHGGRQGAVRAAVTAERLARDAVRDEASRVRARSNSNSNSSSSSSSRGAAAAAAAAGEYGTVRLGSELDNGRQARYHVHYRVPAGVAPGQVLSVSPSGSAVENDEVLVTLPPDAAPGDLVEVLLETGGSPGTAAAGLDPSAGWGYSGKTSRGEVERRAREEIEKQAAELAREAAEPCEIVDGTYTYGEHKDDTEYSYDTDTGKGTLDRGLSTSRDEYVYRG